MKSIRSFSAFALLAVLSISQASAFNMPAMPAIVGKAKAYAYNTYASLYFRTAAAKQAIKNADYKGFAQTAVASKTGKAVLGVAAVAALGYGVYKAVNYYKASKNA